MGINGFWDVIEKTGVVTSLAQWSTDHIKEHGRPLRIAIDEAHWRYKAITVNAFEQIKKDTPDSNPREKNMLARIWALMHIGIEIIFVFDGEGRPAMKRGKKTEDPTGRKAREENNDFFKETLSKLLIPWRQAPGEAEAECAALQRLGLVDAVWSEDSDTLMFGCSVLIKNFMVKNVSKNSDQKSKEEVKVFRLSDIEQKTGIKSTDGIVFYAMLAGCDYTKGLEGCGMAVGRNLATKKLLVEEFAKLSVDADRYFWNLWRKRLEAQMKNLEPALRSKFDKNKYNIGDFPNLEALRFCRNPKISSDNELRHLDCRRGEWYGRYSTESLQSTIPYMRDRFHHKKPSSWWFRYLAPIALNQRLWGMEPGARDLVKKVTQKRSHKVTSTVEIDPSQVFPGIEQAICPDGTLVLNGKAADDDVKGDPLEMVQSEMLDAVLGWGMSSEEFLKWRKGLKKTSAKNGKPASKTSALPNVQTRQRGRKRKAESSPQTMPLQKQPTTAKPPAQFKLYDDNLLDLLGGPLSQEIGLGPVPSGAPGAASKSPSVPDKSTQRKSTNRERITSISLPKHGNDLSVSRENGVSKVVKTPRKHSSVVNSAIHSSTRNVGSVSVLSPVAKEVALQGKGGSIENPIDLDD